MCENSDLIGQTVSDHTKNALRKSTVGGSSPETLFRIKGTVTVIHSTNRVLLCTPLNYGHCPLNSGTAGSHPKERVSGELPRALVYFWKIKCSPADAVCRAFGLVCGIRCSGMAPCGPLYSLRSVCHRQDLDRSRPFRIGEPIRYPPYSTGKYKSELLQISYGGGHQARP